MCGRFNTTDDPFVHALMEAMDVDTSLWPVRCSEFFRAATTISIVRESGNKRIAQDATWWLLLEPTETGFKPSKYTSFNTRYDKLNTPRSAGYKAYRETRCVIVASGFGETEGTRYHNFHAVDAAIAFGGLYRQWTHKGTGEIATSCSIITLPPHEKLKPYHTKASPMMLPQVGSWIDMWLDSKFEDVSQFEPLLEPAMRHNFSVQQIDKPGKRNPLGDSLIMLADEQNL